jgi:hypothetical protein
MTTVASRQMAPVDLYALNYTAPTVDTLGEKLGATAFVKPFPGDAIVLKDSTFVQGFGATAKDLGASVDLVFLVPHYMVGWRIFKTNDKGKQFASYSPPLLPALGQDNLPEREALGPMPVDGEMDPWSRYCVIPVRNVDGDVIHHVQTANKSGNREMHTFFRAAMLEMRTKPGQLPVVRMTVAKKKMGAGADTVKWEQIGLQIVSWTAVTPLDRGVGTAMVDETEGMEAAAEMAANAKVTVALPAPAPAASLPKAVASITVPRKKIVG